jgi:hypothetical protein
MRISSLAAILQSVTTLAAIGCGEGASGVRPDAGSPRDGAADGRPDEGDGSRPGDGRGPDAGVGPSYPTPITERTAVRTHACRVGRDRTDHVPRQWSGREGIVTTRAGVTYLARLESIPPNTLFPGGPGPAQLVVSTLGTDGTLGPTSTLATGDEFGWLAVAPAGEGFNLLWTASTSLRLAGFSAQGNISRPARQIDVPGVGFNSRPRMAAGPDGGYAVAYGVVREGRPPEVHLFVMDAAGTILARPRRLGTGIAPYASLTVEIAASPEGYAVVWWGGDRDAGRIEFAKTDLRGQELVAARTISAPPPADVQIGGSVLFDPPTASILTIEDGYLAAWVERRRIGFSESGAWSITRVARLDWSGVVRGEPVPVRAPALEVDEVEPSMVRFGDTVALFVGQGIAHLSLWWLRARPPDRPAADRSTHPESGEQRRQRDQRWSAERRGASPSGRRGGRLVAADHFQPHLPHLGHGRVGHVCLRTDLGQVQVEQRSEHRAERRSVAGESGDQAGGRHGPTGITHDPRRGSGRRLIEAHPHAEGGELIGLERVAAAAAADGGKRHHQVPVRLPVDQAGGVSELVGGDEIPHFGVYRRELTDQDAVQEEHGGKSRREIDVRPGARVLGPLGDEGRDQRRRDGDAGR